MHFKYAELVSLRNGTFSRRRLIRISPVHLSRRDPCPTWHDGKFEPTAGGHAIFLSYASINSTASVSAVYPGLCEFLVRCKLSQWKALPCPIYWVASPAWARRGGTAVRRSGIRLVLGSYYLRIVTLESAPNGVRIEPEERAKVTWGIMVSRGCYTKGQVIFHDARGTGRSKLETDWGR